MSNVFIKESTLTDIGDAIRAKTGTTDLMLPSAMAGAIEGIKTSYYGTISSIDTTADANGRYHLIDIPKGCKCASLSGSLYISYTSDTTYTLHYGTFMYDFFNDASMKRFGFEYQRSTSGSTYSSNGWPVFYAKIDSDAEIEGFLYTNALPRNSGQCNISYVFSF